MNREALVEAINAEVKRLQKASSILAEGSGRQPVKGAYSKPKAYVMSPAARKRISDSQKARWAKHAEDTRKAALSADNKKKNKKTPAAV